MRWMLMSRAYEKKILEMLINKYHKQGLRRTSGSAVRTPSIKPENLYTGYSKQTGDVREIEAVNKAVNKLESCGFVVGRKKRFSDDLEKIVLNEATFEQLVKYAKKEFDISLPDEELDKEKALVESYQDRGVLTDYYVNRELIQKIEKHTGSYNPKEDEEFLKLLDFVQNNKEELYIREVSMKVFGTSKALEEKYLSRLCNLVQDIKRDSGFDEDNAVETLSDYHIYNVDRDILVKGDIILDFGTHSLNVGDYPDGISIMSSDIARVKTIKVVNSNFITIENKTAFARFNLPDYAVMYLGGFASRCQIQFLRILQHYNERIYFYHFGDIDMGGFRIYDDLCNNTNISITPYHMGIEDLQNPLYMQCLCPLTDNDRQNAQSLIRSTIYGEVIEYMLENNIKLEQEIISYISCNLKERG